jgi:hypothetical protein
VAEVGISELRWPNPRIVRIFGIMGQIRRWSELRTISEQFRKGHMY